ncbi:MBL fold metallo-hydrolase [Clostridium estertheticum]|uniref:MBL fold metallo-hydrolase n=1 Tax=Clostridium estertheticum TaxID=238834 RepID=UPI001C0D0FEA|nr:MBL fold metallo-hydrolase [Clostridium estertheticum]MBU3217330.1 MBL fold metallo-hydrolase [Clostridium estertheticum]WAG55836.1 MBL fold metallo-hydrolase [Clostridium estertheticum]
MKILKRIMMMGFIALIVMLTKPVMALELSSFTDVPNFSVVIGENMYNLDYANDPTNESLISAAIVKNKGDVFVKTDDSGWIKNSDGTKVSKDSVDVSTIKFNNGAAITTAVKVLDTPEIVAEMEKARSLAGDDKSLLLTQLLQSRDLDVNGVPTVAPPVHIAEGSEVPTEPTKLFDNLYYVGGTNVGSFIITTTDGYIMIDAGYDYSPETMILPGMKKLGLDPAKIKYILITHAGPDHVGGAKYFQDNYGTKIVMSQEEWAVAPTKKDANGVNTWPTQDIIGTDGQKLTLGDTAITIVKTPRQVNGGGLSYIAPVFDNGEPHMFATYGNTNVVGTLADKVVYRDSIKHFLSYTDNAKVDVVISDHPFADGSLEKMEELRNLKPGEPNPFVLGQERSRRFFELLDQCAVILTGRQAAGLDETGTKRIDNTSSK